MSRKKTEIEEVLSRILNSPIPHEGQLRNPIEPKKRTPKTHDLMDYVKEGKSYDKPLKDWNHKTYVDYFVHLYHTKSQFNYRVTYRTDMKHITDIMKFMSSNGLDPKASTKEFLEWCFERYSMIQKKSKHFNLQILLNYLNMFYQDTVLPQVESATITRIDTGNSIWDEVAEFESTGKSITEIFTAYGFPVASTYYTKRKGYSEDVLEAGISKMCKHLFNGGAAGKDTLGKIMERSIVASPYHPWFTFLNWREKLQDYTGTYERENWWREIDYKGAPLGEYRQP